VGATKPSAVLTIPSPIGTSFSVVSNVLELALAPVSVFLTEDFAGVLVPGTAAAVLELALALVSVFLTEDFAVVAPGTVAAEPPLGAEDTSFVVVVVSTSVAMISAVPPDDKEVIAVESAAPAFALPLDDVAIVVTTPTSSGRRRGWEEVVAVVVVDIVEEVVDVEPAMTKLESTSPSSEARALLPLAFLFSTRNPLGLGSRSVCSMGLFDPAPCVGFQVGLCRPDDGDLEGPLTTALAFSTRGSEGCLSTPVWTPSLRSCGFKDGFHVGL
jgi:hypothetical protein